jgi:hypothetical protein
VKSAREKLIEATSLVYTNAWLYVNEEPTKVAKVRLSGKPNIETVTPRGRTDFSIGLRAPDPIKYEWNWEDTHGYSQVVIPAKNVATSETGTRTVTNNGNTQVSVILEITGPMTGPGEIYNAATDELITTVQPLRSATMVGVTNKALTSNVVTLTTNTAHNFVSGDAVTVSISDATFDGTHTILSIPSNTALTYGVTAANVASTGASGTAAIIVDILEIDTYAKEVAFNGGTDATRSMVDTLVDWIVLDPGDNEITFEDTGQVNGTASLRVYYRSGWIG